MAGSYIDHALWGTVIGPGQFNPDSAIYKYFPDKQVQVAQ